MLTAGIAALVLFGSGCEWCEIGTKEQCGVAKSAQFAVSRLGPAFQLIGVDGFKPFSRAGAVCLKPR